jgi:2-alkenal reductase
MLKTLTRRLVPLYLIGLLLLTACGRTPDGSPTTIPVIATVDTDEIAAIVLEQIETELDDLARTDSEEASIDMEALVATALAQVEEKLEETDKVGEPVPIAFSDGLEGMTGDDLETSLTELYRLANPAVVYIIVPRIGSGSGFVYDEEGIIVTNNHVVEDGSDFEVVFANGARKRAELIGTDVDSDLAVLRVDKLPEGVQPLTLASFDEIQVGQFVAAIGNPFGEQGSMSLGIVSGLGRSLRSQRELDTGNSFSLPQVIQTDAPINPGNSGVGFAIPVSAIRQIVPSLIKDGEYTYPYMGATFDEEVSLDELSIFDLSQTSGAYVVGISPDSPSERAGLVPANARTGQGGDLIVAIDKQTINNFSDLNSYLVFHAKAGQVIEITALRDGELVTFLLTLGDRP